MIPAKTWQIDRAIYEKSGLRGMRAREANKVEQKSCIGYCLVNEICSKHNEKVDYGSPKFCGGQRSFIFEYYPLNNVQSMSPTDWHYELLNANHN